MPPHYQPKRLAPLNLSNEEMLTELSRRSRGIPDFAKRALIDKAGMPAEEVERADKAGRK
jgi:hypothetical protein